MSSDCFGPKLLKPFTDNYLSSINHLSIYVCIYLFSFSYLYLHICLSIYLGHGSGPGTPVNIPMGPSSHPGTVPMGPNSHPGTHLPIYSSIYLFIYVYFVSIYFTHIYLYIHPPVYPKQRFLPSCVLKCRQILNCQISVFASWNPIVFIILSLLPQDFFIFSDKKKPGFSPIFIGSCRLFLNIFQNS